MSEKRDGPTVDNAVIAINAIKPYISMLRVRYLNGLQYRAAALGGLATQFFWGLMLVFTYKAFYGDAGSSGGFAFKDLISFVWLQQAFLAFIFLYDWDYEMFGLIQSGDVCYELCRPVNLYPLWYVRQLSKRLATGSLRFAPVVIMGFLMPFPYNLSPPASLTALLLFIVTLFLGLALLVAVSMLAFISIFKTMSPIGSMSLFGILGEFFAGMTIPIPLMPFWLQDLCSYMPFRYMSDLPLRAYSGSIGAPEALKGIVAQVFWLAALVLIGSRLMKRITRLTVTQGG